MKTSRLLLLLLMCFAASVVATAPPEKDHIQKEATGIDNTPYINANNILMFVTNHGNFGRDLSGVFGLDAGTFFPYNTDADIRSGLLDDWALYAGGLWVGAKDSATGETRVIISEYEDEYIPGAMADSTFQPDVPRFKVYKLYKDSLADNPNSAYLNWPVQDGAPVDSAGRPAMIGDQMLWSVFNDADTASHRADAGFTNPLGIEVRSTTFAFDRQGALGNIIFMRLQVYNRGGSVLDSLYFSLWSDPDLGNAGDDLVGCDTLLSVGYVYNADNNDDAHYGSKPPCTGFDFFQGPLRQTGNLADTGRMWGQLYPGYTNIGMVSFNRYVNGTDPNSFTETYNYMRGLQADGTPLPNGTNFFHPGDPVAGTGDLDFNPGDRRMMLSTGPIKFRPGDSTEILGAIIFAQGIDRLNSISVMRELDDFAQKLYFNNFNPPDPPAKPVVTVSNLDQKVVLSWGDVSESVPGDYPFQGYAVYQGASPTGPFTLIDVWDVIDGVGNLIDTLKDPASGLDQQIAHRVCKETNLTHHFVVDRNYLTGDPLRNLSTYYFAVEAFSYDATKPRGDKFLNDLRVLTAIPENPNAGTTYRSAIGDSARATHIGGSDGFVDWFVVDPRSVTGRNYRVVFRIDTLLGSVFDVQRQDDSGWATALSGQTNQDGSENYQIVDGLLVRVSGPLPGFKNFEVVANGAGPLNPAVGGAADFQGFPSLDPSASPQQSTSDAVWVIHTGDNGGTADGGTRGGYDAFVDRTTRTGGNWEAIGSFDYEIRFTGDFVTPGVGGSYGWSSIPFGGNGNAIWLPFEIWNAGVGTHTDASDDVQLVAHILDNAGDDVFSLENYGASDMDTVGGPGSGGGYEHSFSGGNNDPYTDWFYWQQPTDNSPGTAGYDAAEAEMLALTYDGARESELMARMVLGQWNGGAMAPFVQDMPEQGTVFRITTTKPNALPDTFTFSTTANQVLASGSEALLDKIKTVPNPYYLFGPYDPAATNRNIIFTNLPKVCSITIYNLAGDFIAEVEKTDDGTSQAKWNVLTERNLPVASGIYIYVVDAPGFGQKVGKMAVFTEVEIINKF